MSLPSWANSGNAWLLYGAISGIAMVVRQLTPQYTIAHKISDKILAWGADLPKFLGRAPSDPNAQPPAQ